jgi:hypothetical protein
VKKFSLLCLAKNRDNIKTRLVDYYLTRKGRPGCDCRYV